MQYNRFLQGNFKKNKRSISTQMKPKNTCGKVIFMNMLKYAMIYEKF